MAGIGIRDTEDKKNPAQNVTQEPGYSYSIGPTPTKVLANSGANMKPEEPTAPVNPVGNSGANKESEISVTLVSGNGPKGWSSPSGGSSGNVASGTAAPTQTNEEKAETSLAKLRAEYAAKIQDSFRSGAEKLKAERDAALRENWILQQQAQAALPEQMAAAGINGGATETSLANLRAMYQGNRNDIQSGYMDNLGELAREQQDKAFEAEKSYNERWMEYLMGLAEAEKQHEYNKELARIR